MKTIKKYLKTAIYINSTSRKLYLILFTVGFAFLFLNIFEPFGLYYNENIEQDDVFIELFIALITAFIILLFSQFVLRKIFKVSRFVFYSYFLWFILEAVLVATAWFVLDITELNAEKINLIDLWFENLFAYMLIMLFPYFLFAVIIHFKELSSENKSLKTDSIQEKRPSIIKFKDETGQVKLVIKPEDLIYINSADNYLEIHYIKDETLSKYLLRNSMKSIEKQLIGNKIIRCHRSFIVNIAKIEIAKKTNTAYQLTLKDIPDTTISVSKSYVSEFRKQIQE